MRRPTVPAVLAAGFAAVIAWSGAAGAATAAPIRAAAAPTGATVRVPGKPAAVTTPATYRHVCSTATAKGVAHCDALVRTDAAAKAVQPNALPAGLGPADLAGAYKLGAGGTGQTVAIAAETTTTTAFDKLTVKAGATALATYSNLNKATGYAQKSFTLTGTAGTTVTISFAGTEDASLQTSFVVDDTALTVS